MMEETNRVEEGDVWSQMSQLQQKLAETLAAQQEDFNKLFDKIIQKLENRVKDRSRISGDAVKQVPKEELILSEKIKEAIEEEPIRIKQESDESIPEDRWEMNKINTQVKLYQKGDSFDCEVSRPNLEPSLQLYNASPIVCEDAQSAVIFDELFAHPQKAHVRIQEHDIKRRSVHQLIDEKLRMSKNHRKKKLKWFPKSWKFKFKFRASQREGQKHKRIAAMTYTHASLKKKERLKERFVENDGIGMQISGTEQLMKNGRSVDDMNVTKRRQHEDRVTTNAFNGITCLGLGLQQHGRKILNLFSKNWKFKFKSKILLRKKREGTRKFDFGAYAEHESENCQRRDKCELPKSSFWLVGYGKQGKEILPLLPKSWKFKFKKIQLKRNGYKHFAVNGILMHLKVQQTIGMGLYAILLMICAYKNNHYESGVLPRKKMSFPEGFELKSLIVSSVLRTDEFPMYDDSGNVSSGVEVAQSIIFASVVRSKAELGEAITRFLHLGLVPLYLSKHENEEATAEVSKTANKKIRRHCDMTLLSCPYARTRNVFEVQDLWAKCGNYMEKNDIHQGPAMIELIIDAISAEVGLDLEIHSFRHVRTMSSNCVKRANEEDDWIEKKEASNESNPSEENEEKYNSEQFKIDVATPGCKRLNIDVSSSVEMNYRYDETILQQTGTWLVIIKKAIAFAKLGATAEDMLNPIQGTTLGTKNAEDYTCPCDMEHSWSKR